MKAIAALLFVTCGAASASPCLDYRETTLRGTLSSETFAGPPDYESIASGDSAETYFFITLLAPVCVSAGSSDLEPAIQSLQRIQLIFESDAAQKSYDSLRPHLGELIECRGVLLGSHTGHHHSEVMLDHAKCHAT